MAGKPFSEDMVAQAFVFGIIVGVVIASWWWGEVRSARIEWPRRADLTGQGTGGGREIWGSKYAWRRQKEEGSR
jgi:hypothetical protein